MTDRQARLVRLKAALETRHRQIGATLLDVARRRELARSDHEDLLTAGLGATAELVPGLLSRWTGKSASALAAAEKAVEHASRAIAASRIRLDRIDHLVALEHRSLQDRTCADILDDFLIRRRQASPAQAEPIRIETTRFRPVPE